MVFGGLRSIPMVVVVPLMLHPHQVIRGSKARDLEAWRKTVSGLTEVFGREKTFENRQTYQENTARASGLLVPKRRGHHLYQ